MSGLGLSDLDDLALTVRDRNSRSYIGEAIRAYRGGAYRSAIMSTWIAVAYDIISKIRELAGQGDGAAVAFVTNLDAAVADYERGAGGAVQRLQNIENDLLPQALTAFEFLSVQEHSDLERLKADRNRLAATPNLTPSLTQVRSGSSYSTGSMPPRIHTAAR
jgi:hypothetical protein